LHRKFLNARSPLRLLEKGLHGGLGNGNLGVVLAGHGVGKTAFLVCVAIDELLRGERVLHVCVGDTLDHVRAFYDTIFEDLAQSTQLEDEAMLHAEIDRRCNIRLYPPNTLTVSKLRDAVKLEAEAGAKPAMIVIEGADSDSTHSAEELSDLKALAQETGSELWVSASIGDEGAIEIPDGLDRDEVSVILALEPGDDAVALRALKDHENTDLEALHVSLDPKTLLLIRS
jgi:hypothetical protein